MTERPVIYKLEARRDGEQWNATIDGNPLARKGKPRRFTSRESAIRAASRYLDNRRKAREAQQ